MDSESWESNSMILLLKLKLKSLFHDPPHKMLVLGKGHERIGTSLSQKILGDFAKGKIANEEDVIGEADSLASSFDRWIIHGEGGAEKGYLSYKRMHNIFSPKESTELNFPPDDEVNRLVHAWAEDLKRILGFVGKAGGESAELNRVWMAYATIFSLYELKWYEVGLPPSLADTRVPTHTVFDHLYATASATNLFYNNGSFSTKPHGFLAVVDIPGVQSLISSSRKLGDFWTASWIVSNLSWRTSWRAIRIFGPDILMFPSPRLNPYLLLSLADFADKGNMKELERELRGDLASLVKMVDPNSEAILTRTYGEKCRSSIIECFSKFIRSVPMIPEKARLVFPNGSFVNPLTNERLSFNEPEDVADNLTKWFKEAWMEIVNEAMNSSSSSEGEHVKEFLKGIIKSFGVIDEPPFMPRIKVLDVSEVLSLKAEELKKRIEKAGLIISENLSQKITEVNSGLLWHVLMLLLDRSPTLKRNPMPRAFWFFDESSGTIKKSFNDSGSKIDKECSYAEGWRPCSLCGEEPAAPLRKKFDSKGEAEFNQDDLDCLIKLAGLSGDKNKLIDDLPNIIKPGESLGPYCLFRRLLYLSKKDIISFESTDRLVLRNLDLVLKESFNKEEFNKLEKEFKTHFANISLLPSLYYVFPEFANKIAEVPSTFAKYEGFEKAAKMLKTSDEKFIQALDNALKELAKNGIGEEKEDQLARALYGAFGFDSFLENEFFSKSRKEILKRLLRIRRSYAILRMDGDSIGRIISGKLLEPNTAQGSEEEEVITLKKYVEDLYEEMMKSASSKEEMDFINNLKDLAEKNASMLEKEINEKIVEERTSRASPFKGIFVSPSYYMHVSTVLMLQAIKDTLSVMDREGFPIYAGGDDVNALLPIERSLDTAFELRKSFWFWEEKGRFAFLHSGGSLIPVTSLITTGRSGSLRYASLKDLTGEEIAKAGELLEELAKKAVWELNGKRWKKDTLVLSDSTGKHISLIPFSVPTSASNMSVNNKLKKAISVLWSMRILGMASGNIPEDMFSYIPAELWKMENKKEDDPPLEKMTKVVFERNIKLPGSADDKKELLNKLDSIMKEAEAFSLRECGSRVYLIHHIIKAYNILRDLP